MNYLFYDLIFGVSYLGYAYLNFYKMKKDFEHGIDSFFSRAWIPINNLTVSRVGEHIWKKIESEKDFQEGLARNKENNNLVKYASELVKKSRLEDSLDDKNETN